MWNFSHDGGNYKEKYFFIQITVNEKHMKNLKNFIFMT